MNKAMHQINFTFIKSSDRCNHYTAFPLGEADPQLTKLDEETIYLR